MRALGSRTVSKKPGLDIKGSTTFAIAHCADSLSKNVGTPVTANPADSATIGQYSETIRLVSPPKVSTFTALVAGESTDASRSWYGRASSGWGAKTVTL